MCVLYCVFFFKQKTAYEMRISDWSSDVCSSDLADPMRAGPIFLANHAGGVAGGISTGQPVVVRVAFKPTSSILTPLPTIDRTGAETEIRTRGRHDPCVGIRGAPVVEAMMALALADQKLLHRAQCG